MKRIKRLLLILMIIVPLYNVNAACVNSNGTGKKGSVSLSASSLTVYKGKTATFKINAPCAAGKLSISSSNTSVATVTPKTDFVDDSSVKVTVKGLKVGSSTITVTLNDIVDYAERKIGGTRKVTVNVKEYVAPKPKPKEIKEMKINSFEIVGYDINFDVNTLEYLINVHPDVKKIYINIKGENFTSSGDKIVNIEGKDSVVVSLKDDVKTLNYTIKINRIETAITPVEPQQIIKEVVKVDKTYVYITYGLLGLCLILIILLLSSRKKKIINEVIPQAQVVPNVNGIPIQNQTIVPQNQMPNQIDNNLQ